jgi:CheY-like chemotaxis protein
VPTAPLTRCHTLIVEDHDVSRDMLARLLRHLGHELVAAGSVAEAVAAIAEWTPECVALDLMLPDSRRRRRAARGSSVRFRRDSPTSRFGLSV